MKLKDMLSLLSGLCTTSFSRHVFPQDVVGVGGVQLNHGEQLLDGLNQILVHDLVPQEGEAVHYQHVYGGDVTLLTLTS